MNKRKAVIVGLGALLAVASTGPSAQLHEDGSLSVSLCLPMQPCSGLVYPYGNADTANEGWVIGNCGWETRGEPGPFCLWPNE